MPPSRGRSGCAAEVRSGLGTELSEGRDRAQRRTGSRRPAPRDGAGGLLLGLMRGRRPRGAGYARGARRRSFGESASTTRQAARGGPLLFDRKPSEEPDPSDQHGNK